jgi:hypothetical protein
VFLSSHKHALLACAISFRFSHHFRVCSLRYLGHPLEKRAIASNDSTNQTPAQTFEVFTFLLGNWLCMRDFDYFEKLQ